jgi:hypothetical protein
LPAIFRTAHNLLRNLGLRQALAPLQRQERVMANPSTDRPKNRETEYEDLKPRDGGPPRPATEPEGSKQSVQSPKTATDPGSGESKP